MSWTDPGDTTITGYQVLRGPDADNLAVLTDDTESAGTSHTDDTVEAQTKIGTTGVRPYSQNDRTRRNHDSHR